MANYRKAVGADALKSLSMTVIANVAMNETNTLEMSAIFPDKFWTRQSRSGLTIDTVLNGERGWAVTPQGTIQLASAQMAGLKDAINLYILPVKYAKSETQRKVTGIEREGDRSYYVVQSPAVKRCDWLYFDTQSGLLVKVRTEFETVLGTSVRITTLEDYRDLNGVKIPYRIFQHFMGNQAVNEITEAKVNIDLDSAKFEPLPERKSIKVDSKILDAYAGEYRFTVDTILTVSREGDKLFLVQPNFPQKIELFAATATDFFAKVVPEQITFVKNDKGEVIQAVLHQVGSNREMKKVK